MALSAAVIAAIVVLSLCVVGLTAAVITLSLPKKTTSPQRVNPKQTRKPDPPKLDEEHDHDETVPFVPEDRDLKNAWMYWNYARVRPNVGEMNRLAKKEQDVQAFLDASVKRETIAHFADVYPEKRVALCVSGHFRNLEMYRDWWAYISLFKNVDVYVHTWTDVGKRTSEKWIDASAAMLDLPTMVEMVKPKAHLVEDVAPILEACSLKKQGRALYFAGCQKRIEDFSKFIVCQLYSVQKSYQLMKQSGVHYDVVVRTRADAVMKNFNPNTLLTLQMEINGQPAVYFNYGDSHVHPLYGGGCTQCEATLDSHHEHTNDVCDVFYYGNEKGMEPLMNMYDDSHSLADRFAVENAQKMADPSLDLVGSGQVDGSGEEFWVKPLAYERHIKCIYPERMLREQRPGILLLSDPCRSTVCIYR